MANAATLVTGFEPFAGLDRNPSAEVARRLDGSTVGGAPVVARILPVSLAGYLPALERAIGEVDPALVIALGLAQGEAAIRVERVGLNLADFEIPDNDGLRVAGQPVQDGGPQARFSTIPVAGIVRAMLAEGIPAYVSNSAGAYLCNACLYSLLAAPGAGFTAGFIHLPYLPDQVAALLAGDPRAGPHMPSMSLDDMVRAVGIAIAVSRETSRPA